MDFSPSEWPENFHLGATQLHVPMFSGRSTGVFVGMYRLAGGYTVCCSTVQLPKNDTLLWRTAYLLICVRSPRCEPRIVCKHSPPQVCALYHFVGNWNWSQKKGAERPSSLRGATLQAIHHLAAACLSSFPLCLSPAPSLSSAPLFLSKKKPLLPSKNPSSFCPPQSPPLPPSLGLCLILEEKSLGSVMAYGYLTSASPLIRLSSLNDATCGATNATEKSIKAFH